MWQIKTSTPLNIYDDTLYSISMQYLKQIPWMYPICNYTSFKYSSSATLCTWLTNWTNKTNISNKRYNKDYAEMNNERRLAGVSTGDIVPAA